MNTNDEQDDAFEANELDDSQLEDVAGGAAWSPKSDWSGVSDDQKSGSTEWGSDGWAG